MKFIFTGYKILCWQFFLSVVEKYYLACFRPHDFWWEIHCHLNCLLSIWRIIFSLLMFSRVLKIILRSIFMLVNLCSIFQNHIVVNTFFQWNNTTHFQNMTSKLRNIFYTCTFTWVFLIQHSAVNTWFTKIHCIYLHLQDSS